MLEMIGKMVLSFLFNSLVGMLQLWWARRQAAQYQAAAELANHQFASLQAGNAAQVDIQMAAENVRIQSGMATSWQDQLAQMISHREMRKQLTTQHAPVRAFLKGKGLHA